MAVYDLKYPSTVASEAKMAERLQALLEENNVPQNELRRFVLAMSEAFTNALIHGNRRTPYKDINIRVSINNQALSADIVDQGQGGLERIRHRPAFDQFSESGRGIDLMKHCVTAVEFTETEKGGLRVSIRLDRVLEENLNSL